MDQRHGRAWLPEEEHDLRKAYSAGVPILEIASRHQRSRQAIRKRLMRLGLLAAETSEKSASAIPQSPADKGPIRAWTYLLISERGEVYLGATTHLRQRLRRHNSSGNTRWTKGRKWHLLAARGFETRADAFAYERQLKKRPDQKKQWRLQSIDRANKIASRHGYEFCPKSWLIKRSNRSNT